MCFEVGDTHVNEFHIDWDVGIKSVLKQLKHTIEPLFDGTVYSVERNSTVGEKDLDVFKHGETGRVSQIWPKTREGIMDISITTSIFSSLKTRIAFPQDYDIKPGRYLNWRKFKSIKLDQAMLILKEISKI